VLPRLEYQAAHAVVWRDAVTQYFLKLSGILDARGRAGNYPHRLEAENARLTGYKIIDVNPWEDASHGKAVSCDIPRLADGPESGHDFSRAERAPNKSGASAPARNHSCAADFSYTGQAGRFNIAVQYFDLQGGDARFSTSINGQHIDTWTADDKFPSRRPNGDNSTRHILHNVTLKPGDTIRIEGTPNAADPAALDYIELLPVAAAQ
jgi:alpha-glucuronidase